MAKIEEYSPIVGQPTIDDLKLLGQKLKGKIVQNINSTPVGGGVAEILSRMIPLLNELGVDARWDFIKGGNQFFEVTKKFHNALHGRHEEIDNMTMIFLWKRVRIIFRNLIYMVILFLFTIHSQLR
jgi:trehalose synthase